MIKNYLLDKEFLEELHLSKQRTIYAKIVLLSYSEHPLKEIQGIITGGSINIDGESSLRRTCTLSLDIPNIYEQDDVPINFNSKFNLSIGLKNEINNEYPDIIWFEQGLYIVTNFNISYSEQKISLSITGKDKMCLLNGEISGQFYAQTKLDTLEIVDKEQNVVFQKIAIKDIIYNLLYEMGHELPYNIIISDLDEYGYELWEYRGKEPLYIAYKNIEGNYIPYNFTQDKNIILKLFSGDKNIKNIEDIPIYSPENNNKDTYKVQILTTGQLAGYHQTQLIYPSDLVANVGENVVTILDKIKNLLGTFEYFYDVDGKFIFQKKKQYIVENNRELINYSFDIINNLQFENLFNSDALIKSIQPSHKATDIKNDFIVWGSRESVSGANIDIHARVAIDRKPIKYYTIIVTEDDINYLRSLFPDQYPLSNSHYIQQESELFHINKYDWREIIYQMANDYFKYHLLDDFYQRVEIANPEYINGITGYEQYYTDMIGFWRQLYDIKKTPGYSLLIDTSSIFYDEEKKCYVFMKDNNKIDVYYKNSNYNPYDDNFYNNIEYAVLKPGYGFSYYLQKENEEEFIKICGHTHFQYYSLTNDQEDKFYEDYDKKFTDNYLSKNISNLYEQVENYEEDYWHKNVKNNPALLNFWIDFVEPNGEMEQFGISNIGDRIKSKSDNEANILLTEKIPNIQFYPTDEVQISQGNFDLDTLQIQPNIRDMFVIASKKTSVISKVNELINTHTQHITSVNITSLPVYYLQPNKMIYINNTSSKINGKFNISKISMPLTYNGTMSITGTKILEQTMEVQE